jgi:hypothetical protein
MQTSLSSKLPIKLPAIPKKVERYFVEPFDHIGLAIVWSSTTASVVLGSMRFVLIIVTRILPHFARLWAASFPTSGGDFASTPIGLLFSCTIFFCLLNVYSVKQTRKAYKELHVWVISIRHSWIGKDGEQHTLNHLTVALSGTKKNMSRLRDMALSQCLSLLRQHELQDQSSSSTVAVVNDNEMTATMMTTISSEEVDCVSDIGASTGQQASVVSGIFGTVLSSFQIRVVGPTGLTSVIDLRRRPYRLLWLYLVAFFFIQQSVCVGDLRRDVYDYDDEEDEDKKKKLRNRFHRHCSTLREEINVALCKVGLPETNPLRCDFADGTTFWHLADTIQFEDLTLLEECKTLLADVKDPCRKSVVSHERTEIVCEELGRIMGDLAVLKHYQETPAIQELLQEILATATQALKYLAERYQTAAQQSTETEVRHQFIYKEEHSWATRALLYARFAPIAPDNYKLLSRRGEEALRNALSCCKTLQDQDRAFDLYQKYRKAKEQDGDHWKPEAETEECWRSVLSLDKLALRKTG